VTRHTAHPSQRESGAVVAATAGGVSSRLGSNTRTLASLPEGKDTASHLVMNAYVLVCTRFTEVSAVRLCCLNALSNNTTNCTQKLVAYLPRSSISACDHPPYC
jgi:hypothetical protein